MKVKATMLGFMYNRRFREGDIFELRPVKGRDGKGQEILVSAEKQFSRKWMEVVSPKVKVTQEPVSVEGPDVSEVEEAPEPEAKAKVTKKKVGKKVASVI